MDRNTNRYLKNKGRSKQRFVGLPYNMLESAAWKSLTPQAVLIFIELKRRYNGSNNGEIGLSCREASVVGRCGKGTASRRLDELVKKGFIKVFNKGHFHNRHSTTWALTCEVFDKKPPTNDWKEYSKDKK